MPVEPRQLLRDGAQQLRLSLTASQLDTLMNYLSLLQRWGKVINLTAIKSTQGIIGNHLLDSIAIIPYLNGERFVDIGTGAGLPGMVLAICQPDRQFLLVDSLGKRCRFLYQATTELQLSNVTIIESRIEAFNLNTSNKLDGIICRAFASLNDTVKACSKLIRNMRASHQTTHFYCMKGTFPQREIEQLLQRQSPCNIQKCYQLDVPLLNAERHLVHFTIE